MEKQKFLRTFWQLAKPYWVSEQRGKGLALLAAVVGLTLGLVWINVELNYWNRAFYDAIQEKKIDDFYRLLGKFTLLAFAFIAVGLAMKAASTPRRSANTSGFAAATSRCSRGSTR